MPTKTVTGNPITITDALPVNAVSVTGVKDIFQYGSGNPSGTNIRAIYDFPGDVMWVKVTGAGGSTNTYYVSLVGAGGGICQGTLNFLTGELTITHRVLILTGGENWSKYNSTSYSFTYYIGASSFKNYVGNILIDSAANYATGNLAKCSHAIISQYIATTYSWRFAIAMNSNNLPLLYFTPTSDYTTIQEWKDYLAAQYSAGTPVQITYPLAASETYTLTGINVPLLDGYNLIDTNLDSLTIQYNVKSFSVNVPALFTASPSDTYEGNTVTITYTGENRIDTLVAVGVDTLDNIPLTKTSDNTWTFTMPAEDVGVTVGFLPFATIEVIQSTGGTIVADKTVAYEGDVVTLTLVPDENYEPMNVKVTKDARDVATTEVSDNQYQFTVHIQ